MSILNVNTIQPIGSGTTVTVAATELKTSNFITVGTGASVTSPSANVLTLGTNNAERLRITSAGLIGIGTVSPSGSIHAHTASGTQRSYLEASASHSFLRLKSGSTSYNSGVEFFSGASNIANVNGLGAGGLQFEVNGSERLRITSAGNIGIGTDTPYANNSFNSLSIGGSGKYGLIELNKSDGVAGSWIDVYGTNGNGDLRITTAGTSGAITFWTGGSFTEKVRITSGGLVGINTAIPDRALHVFSTNGTVAHFESGNANTVSQIVFEGLGASAPPNLGATGEHLHFTTNNLERVRIASNGLVGIATAVPSYRLDIGDGATDPANGYQLRVNASGDYIFALQRQSVPSFSIRNNSTGIVHLNTQNSKILSLGVSSGNSSGSIEDDVRIDSNGHLTIVDGNLIVANGHGIDFSATANSSGSMGSEVFDDYEEGTFTVGFTQSGATITANSSYNTMNYTKVGRICHIFGHIRVSTVSGSGSGNIKVTGLPFQIISGVNAGRGGLHVTFLDISESTYGESLKSAPFQFDNGTTRLELETARFTSISQYGNGDELMISATYLVA